MPYVALQTNIAVTDVQKQSLLSHLTVQVARILKKPESYMMVVLQANTCMNLGNSGDACAHLLIKSIGFAENSVAQLSSELTQLLHDELAIVADRVFIEFCDVSPEKWAWQGKTFA